MRLLRKTLTYLLTYLLITAMHHKQRPASKPVGIISIKFVVVFCRHVGIKVIVHIIIVIAAVR